MTLRRTRESEGKRREMRIFIVMLGLSTMVATLSCGGRMPEEIGTKQGVLRPCPDKPNCVSSGALDAEHAIAALEITGTTHEAWQGLKALLDLDSSAEIVASETHYLHAVFTSTIMRYRDDVEFVLNETAGEIDLRSASRVGHSDMGVNRGRVESIRAALADKGLVSSE